MNYKPEFALFCDTVTTCDNLIFMGCHTASLCLFSICDNVTTKLVNSLRMRTHAPTPINLCIYICHSVTSIYKSVAYDVTTIGFKVVTGWSSVTNRIFGDLVMEWESKYSYSMRKPGSDGKGELFPVYKFVSPEGYQVGKSVKTVDSKGTVTWLFTAARPKHKKYKSLPGDSGWCLGHFPKAQEAADACVAHHEMAMAIFAEQAMAKTGAKQ